MRLRYQKIQYCKVFSFRKSFAMASCAIPHQRCFLFFAFMYKTHPRSFQVSVLLTIILALACIKRRQTEILLQSVPRREKQSSKFLYLACQQDRWLLNVCFWLLVLIVTADYQASVHQSWTKSASSMITWTTHSLFSNFVMSKVTCLWLRWFSVIHGKQLCTITRAVRRRRPTS